MTAEIPTSAVLAGEYRVTTQRRGQGLDHYMTVRGPDGRSSDQKVIRTYSMTLFQVAETAVTQHLEQDGSPMAAPTREDTAYGGYIVTVG